MRLEQVTARGTLWKSRFMHFPVFCIENLTSAFFSRIIQIPYVRGTEEITVDITSYHFPCNKLSRNWSISAWVIVLGEEPISATTASKQCKRLLSYQELDVQCAKDNTYQLECCVLKIAPTCLCTGICVSGYCLCASIIGWRCICLALFFNL